jgi:hypothetical protein
VVKTGAKTAPPPPPRHPGVTVYSSPFSENDVYAPSSFTDSGPLPLPLKLELEFACVASWTLSCRGAPGLTRSVPSSYGCNGQRHNTVRYISSGEIAYAAGALVVLYDRTAHRQRFFQRHTAEVLWCVRLGTLAVAAACRCAHSTSSP